MDHSVTSVKTTVALHIRKDIHELALVLVDPLDLNVKESAGVDSNATVFLDILRETDLPYQESPTKLSPDLARVFHVHPSLLESSIICVLCKILQLTQILQPSQTAKFLRDQIT